MKKQQLLMKQRMLIKLSALLLLHISGIHNGVAATYRVNTEQARKVAETFLQSKIQTKQEILLLNQQIHSPYEHLYFFGNEECFVVVSDYSAVRPILGYSTESGFCDHELPDNVCNWLKSYDDEIEYTLKNGIASTETIDLEWNNLLNGKGLMSKSERIVEPLIQTHWSQRMPYNSLCPNQDELHAVTGCVATAMAQVMNYWEHPVKGKSSHSYQHWGEWLSVNFGATTYDWDLMKDFYIEGQYSEQEANAIGILMYHCGVSVDMDYGLSQSRAYFESVENAMERYFKYDTAMHYCEKYYYNQMVYSDEEWIAMLKKELDFEQPILYKGGYLSSHAFICDGYDANDYFHFNWGWGSSYDGYFAIGHLNPNNYDFNQINCVYLGCRPSQISILPPPNVFVKATGRNVSISWSSIEEASSYKVYRDNHVVATNITDTNYIDQSVDYGEHFYYLKSVSSDGTTSLKSEDKSVEVLFMGTPPTNLKAVQSDNSVNLSWEITSKSRWLKYGDGDNNIYSGYNGGTYWAQHYDVSTLANYAGMTIDKVSVYINHIGNYSLFIYKGNATTCEELVYQKDFVPSDTGWTQICFSNSVPLDYTKDLWVVFFSDAYHPAVGCSYNGPGCGIGGAALMCSSLENGWFSINEGEISWKIRIGCTRKDSFNVYRNGDIIVSGLDENHFENMDLEEGFYEYHVTNNHESHESQPTNTVTIEIAVCSIIATVDITNGCTINGDGAYYRGQFCTLTAVPSNGYKFVNWTENDSIVSTSNTYSFIVKEPRILMAHVKNNTSIDETQTPKLSIYPNPTTSLVSFEAEGLKYVTISNMLGQTIYDGNASGDEFNYDFSEHETGIYLIRIETANGMAVKKVSVVR